jgi:hypothetical protein
MKQHHEALLWRFSNNARGTLARNIVTLAGYIKWQIWRRPNGSQVSANITRSLLGKYVARPLQVGRLFERSYLKIMLNDMSHRVDTFC